MDLTQIFTATAPTLVLAVVVAAVLFFGRGSRKLTYGKLGVAFGDAEAWTFLIEILSTNNAVNRAIGEMRRRQRKLVDDALQQWRSQTALMFAEEFLLKGYSRMDLSSIPEYLKLQVAMKFAQYELKRRMMTDIETNGFDEFRGEVERDQYIGARIETVHQIIRETVDTYFVVPQNDVVMPPEVFNWLSNRRLLTEQTFRSAYVAVIRETLRIKGDVTDQAKIAIDKARDMGCPAPQADHLQRLLTVDALEAL